jgi:hypothetical protein
MGRKKKARTSRAFKRVEGPPSPFHRLDVATVSLILDYAVADVSELLPFREVCAHLDRPCGTPLWSLLSFRSSERDICGVGRGMKAFEPAVAYGLNSLL